jgi:hypothetical protein
MYKKHAGLVAQTTISAKHARTEDDREYEDSFGLTKKINYPPPHGPPLLSSFSAATATLFQGREV